MRPLRPFCGTVSNAQLLTLPATISTSANGVVTTQLSFLPPASSSATDVPESSESRPASALPPEPPPTITKSNVSVTRVPPGLFLRRRLRFCAVSGKSGSTPPYLQPKPAVWPSQNPQNRAFCPFQSRLALIHTPRTRWRCPGCLLRKPLGRFGWRLGVGRFRFRPGFPKGAHGLTRGGAAR